MRRVANGIPVLTVAALLMTAAACGQSGPPPNVGQTSSAGPSGAADVDRTALPIAEPTRPAITELDARNVKPPPIFEVKAPAGAPNVIVMINLRPVTSQLEERKERHYHQLVSRLDTDAKAKNR